MTKEQKIAALELIGDKLQNLGDECYDLGFEKLGNAIMDKGHDVYVQIEILQLQTTA